MKRKEKPITVEVTYMLMFMWVTGVIFWVVQALKLARFAIMEL